MLGSRHAVRHEPWIINGAAEGEIWTLNHLLTNDTRWVVTEVAYFARREVCEKTVPADK